MNHAESRRATDFFNSLLVAFIAADACRRSATASFDQAPVFHAPFRSPRGVPEFFAPP